MNPRYGHQSNAFDSAIAVVVALTTTQRGLQISEQTMTGGAGAVNYGIKVRTPQRIAELKRRLEALERKIGPIVGSS